jgi:hypothetical protein
MFRAAILIIGAAASAASAQVIYEPVVTQYGGQNPYYYAGTDPYVHEAARFPSAPGAIWGRIPGYAFVSPRRQVVQRNVRVFTDAFGSLDARPWGLTPNQVVNEANARLPKYFSKRDLLAQAQTRARPEGPVFIVPPYAGGEAERTPRGTMSIRPSPPRMYRSNPVFSFPREMMNRKVDDVSRRNGVQRV